MEDVAAFPGRFVRLGDEIRAAEPEFGASRHIARIVLTVMAYDPRMRAAMNIRFSPEIIARARKAGLRAADFSRAEEPARRRSNAGAPLSWGVDHVLRRSAKIPDLVFDRGGMGKEAMVRVLGRGPADVAEKVIKILEAGAE